MISEREKTKREFNRIIAEAKKKGQLKPVFRKLASTNLYFLLLYVLRRKDMDSGPEYKRDWLYKRCKEVQAQPDGMLDLWAREHYKSTIISFGKTIQDIILNPEVTIGILSFNRPTAKTFLLQIKRELETNNKLKKFWPEIFWEFPQKHAPKWSENDGIIVKRKGNPKESTVEAWGLVDGQPTGRHFDILLFDDIITRESCTTPDMIKKVTECWELAQNLGKEGGRKRYAGTHYHFADTYHTIRERGAATPRIYPGTDNGKADGNPVLFTPEYMAEKRRDMGTFIFACQILLDPKAGDAMGFKDDNLRYWRAQHFDHLNIYILVDPAGSKKNKGNDYTVFMIVGLGPDQNYYVIDMIRDRLNLNERTARLFSLHRQYRPIAVGYEEYSMQADIEHIQDQQEKLNYRFDITPLKGKVAKNERIGGLIPLSEDHRLYLPESCPRVNYDNVTEDLTRVFINEEYRVWPYSLHDDMLDCLARIRDPELGAEFPAADDYFAQTHADGEYDELDYGRRAA